MEFTPKVQKRASLSLGSRLHNKRHSASPQNLINAGNNANPARSPSVMSVSSDCGIECTPPHRKYNFDDSIDYSPKPFDTSFSPSGLLSQTLAIDSPEVGWRWARRTNSTHDSDAVTTPDSAYAADSSTSSNACDSNSKEHIGARTRSETQKRLSNELRRQDYRKAYEQEIRRAEKTKADEMLKKRCAKLQEQLKEAELRSKKVHTNETTKHKPQTHTNANTNKTSKSKSQPKQAKQSPQKLRHSSMEDKPDGTANKNKTLDEFFNDSDIDGFLIEATQQCESKLDKLIQKQTAHPSNECDNEELPNSAPAATTPSTAVNNREKRTSFYMKFLEDDLHDDWFVSLDEEVLQATQAKKPKTSLQRYKSMPTDTTTAGAILTNTATIARTSNSNSNTVGSGTPKFKRHASSHAISPNAANYRGRQRKH